MGKTGRRLELKKSPKQSNYLLRCAAILDMEAIPPAQPCVASGHHYHDIVVDDQAPVMASAYLKICVVKHDEDVLECHSLPQVERPPFFT